MAGRFLVPASIFGTAVGVYVLLKDTQGGEQAPKDIKIPGRTVVITGASSGIGKEVAFDLAGRGARVIMACRNLKKCEEVRKEIMEQTYNLNVECQELELASMASVRKFAEQINLNEERLDVLINNAGAMGFKERKITKDGIEMHLAVNYLGHFLLTNLLLDKLKKSAPSRVINTSTVKVLSKMDFKDLNAEKKYDWHKCYQQSKLANILFTKELDRRYRASGIHSFCVIPILSNTDIGRELGMNKNSISYVLTKPFRMIFETPPIYAAQTAIYCAIEPSVLTDTVNFYKRCYKIKSPEHSEDEFAAKRLWVTSEKWTRLT